MQQSMMPDYVNDKFTNQNIKEGIKKLYYKNPKIFDMSNDDIMLEYWLEYNQLAVVLGDKLDDFIKWYRVSMRSSTLERAVRYVREELKIPKKSKRYLEKQSEDFWRKE